MSVENLLSRLQKVKKTGNGKWMCQCPSHNDKTASMVVNDVGDGRILINCFAGCDTYSILRDIGLDWQDVMPENAIDNNLQRVKKFLYPSEALEIVKFEAQIVSLIAIDIKNKQIVTPEMLDRLLTSVERINKSIEATK